MPASFAAKIGMETFWVGAEIDREISDGVGVRNFPWLRRISQVAVGRITGVMYFVASRTASIASLTVTGST